MKELTHQSLEEALASFRRRPGMTVPFALHTDYPIGTEKVINGQRYRLVEDGPGAAKVMRVTDDGDLEEI